MQYENRLKNANSSQTVSLSNTDLKKGLKSMLTKESENIELQLEKKLSDFLVKTETES